MTGWVVILRPLFMWVAARLAWTAQPFIAVRWASVAAVGHPGTAFIVTTWGGAAMLGGVRVRAAVLIILLVFALEKALGLLEGSPVRLWQLAWSTKRRWPVQYTIVDNATQDVQASFGGAGTSFLSGSRRLTRPILGHPALSLLPRIDWAEWTATWGVHANAGQTLPALAKVSDSLASRFPYCDRVDVDYPTPQASIGAIRFWYRPEADALEGTETAALDTSDTTTELPVGAPDDGLGDYDGTANW